VRRANGRHMKLQSKGENGSREVDMTIYVYRLLLELAHRRDPERQAGNLETNSLPID